MTPLYTQIEFDSAKSQTKLPCKCEYCHKTFHKPKKEIVYELKNNRGTIRFCSIRCCNHNSKGIKQLVLCDQCNTQFEKHTSQIKKSSNNFCSGSCRTRYGNLHKTHGINRSKLEIYLEEQLSQIFPDLTILYNRKDIIKSELDIYIPSLSLAFELNGIFHYEPIFGATKLNQTQNNDERKFQACLEHNIELCIIDTSSLINFKPLKAQKYLDIVIKIINQRTSVLTS